MNISDKIENMISPIIKAMGYELWGVELHRGGRRSLLRIYIDVPLTEHGKNISIDDCSKVSNQIGAAFDVENPITGSYSLEVSSPGLSRSLFKPEHYNRYIGSSINVSLLQPENGKRRFIGKIQEVFDNKLELIVDDEIMVLDLINISKANLNL